MKRTFRKWALRLTATILLIFGLLLTIILNPTLSYAGRTDHDHFHIYHNQPLTTAFLKQLDQAQQLVAACELFDPRLHTDICLNDGSAYPALIKKLTGPAFARGFYDKVVLMGSVDPATNRTMVNGREWNTTELLAHELVHDHQFKALGFFHSNPMAGIPVWKWEGYPEYVARQQPDCRDLRTNIRRWLDAEQHPDNGWISFPDGSGTVTEYYQSWLLVQYCLDIEHLNYLRLLRDTRTADVLFREMMKWFKAK